MGRGAVLMTIKTLPALDWKLGFPQRKRVSISTNSVKKAYDFRFRWNGDLFICEITRVADAAVMWKGVLHKLNPVEIRDPTTHAVQYTLLARELDYALESLEIWVFEE